MGDADNADPALVPDAHWMDDPHWVASTGYHRVDANYKLLNDNLLDLSYETYVHTRTIGNEAVAESPIAIRTEGSVVKVDKKCRPAIRRGSNSIWAGYQRRTRSGAGSARCTSRRDIIVIDVGVEALEPVPGSVRVEARVIDLITPESATSSPLFLGIRAQFPARRAGGDRVPARECAADVRRGQGNA